jgi:hypothetical protein
MSHSIWLTGCSQPHGLPPERAPMIEATFDVRIQHILGFVADFKENGSDGIVLAASRSKSITGGFEAGFPFWFQGLRGLVPDRPCQTSPEYRAGASPTCRAWESRPDVPVSPSAAAGAWGGSRLPARVVPGVSGTSPRPLPPFSCPGYLASPGVPPTIWLTVTSSVIAGVCGPFGRCHAQRLGRFSFVAGRRAAPACARVAGSSLRSPLPRAPWFLCYYSGLYPPSDCACVSISPGFPGGFGFSGNPTPTWLAAWTPAHRFDHR